MKRFLLILLVLLMPLQSSWAAVMAYGQHVGVGESTDHCRQAVKALIKLNQQAMSVVLNQFSMVTVRFANLDIAG